jgi:protein-disulfide isomerase
MNKVFIPISIVVSGLIIAGAIYMTTSQQSKTTPTTPDSKNIELSIAPIDKNDHIIGNPDAEVVIVEYSDFQCPFCKGFHETMNKIMEEYGPSGKVAWVYRQFPLTQIHPLAQPAAEASECIAKLGGNSKFWEFSNNIIPQSPDSLSTENLLAGALKVGINEADYKACLASDYPKKEVAKDVTDGNAIAAVDKEFGTPYNILISKSGGQIPLKGNQPYANVKSAIDAILTGTQAK